MARTTGWQIFKGIVDEQLKAKQKRLESCYEYELHALQGYIKGLRMPIAKVEDLIKGDKEDAVK